MSIIKFKCCDCGQEVLKPISIMDTHICSDCISEYDKAREDAFAEMLPQEIQAILDVDYAEGI